MEEVRPRPTAMHFLTHMHPDLTPAQILEMVRLQTAPEPADEPAGADCADVDDAETDLNLDDEDDVDVDEDDVDVDEDDGEFLWLDEEGADVPAEEEETEDEREVNDVERTSSGPSPGPGPGPRPRGERRARRGAGRASDGGDMKRLFVSSEYRIYRRVSWTREGEQRRRRVTRPLAPSSNRSRARPPRASTTPSPPLP